MECPVCKKEFNESTGRRPKKFCSDRCKVGFWNAKKRVVENNKPENKKKIIEERNPSVQVKNFNQPQDASNFTIDTTKHKLWKEGDPKEGSMAFFSKYGASSYDELEKLSQ